MSMLDDTLDQLHLPQRRNVRLDTLLRLRWLAIIGQSTAVLVVHYGLDFPLPIWACLAVIALSAWLNVALRLRFAPTQRLEPERAAWLLAFDIAELAVLLFLTGGLQNPFAFLFLAPVLLSATALPPRLTLMLGGFAVLCATILVFAHYPAAVGYRGSAGTAVDLSARRLALDPARDRLHRRLRVADHRGRPPARRGAGRHRAGAGARAGSFRSSTALPPRPRMSSARRSRPSQ